MTPLNVLSRSKRHRNLAGCLLYYDLNEPLPDHSSLTRIRTRYGVEVFRRFFEAIVEQCQQQDWSGGGNCTSMGPRCKPTLRWARSNLAFMSKRTWTACLAKLARKQPRVLNRRAISRHARKKK